MKTLLCAVLALLLAACGTAPEVTKAMLAAHEAAQARPTLQLECPSGCKFAYTDPRDRVAFKAPTNGYDAMISIGGNLTGLAQSVAAPLILGKVAIEGMRSLQGSGAVTTTTTSSVVAPVTTTATTSTVAPVITRTTTVGANSGAGSGVTTTNTSTSSTTSTSTVGANSGANSGNTSTTTSNTSNVGANSGAGSGDGRNNSSSTSNTVNPPPASAAP